MQKLELMEFRLTAWSNARGCSKSVVLKIIKSNKNGISFFFFFIAKFWQCFVMKEVMNLEEGKGGVVWFLKPADATSLQTHITAIIPCCRRQRSLLFVHLFTYRLLPAKWHITNTKKDIKWENKNENGIVSLSLPLSSSAWEMNWGNCGNSVTQHNLSTFPCLLAGVMKLTQISNKFQIDES